MTLRELISKFMGDANDLDQEITVRCLVRNDDNFVTTSRVVKIARVVQGDIIVEDSQWRQGP